MHKSVSNDERLAAAFNFIFLSASAPTWEGLSAPLFPVAKGGAEIKFAPRWPSRRISLLCDGNSFSPRSLCSRDSLFAVLESMFVPLCAKHNARWISKWVVEYLQRVNTLTRICWKSADKVAMCAAFLLVTQKKSQMAERISQLFVHNFCRLI